MRNFTVSLFGLLTSLLVVGILVFMELKWDFAFYSVMHFFIIPTGAIVSGMCAAAGYYLGAIVLNVRPSRTILFNMVFISITAYFTLHYLTYELIEVDGESLSSLIAFPDYMKFILTNMSMTLGRGSSSATELGNAGYIFALLQVIGFASGGIACYFILKGKIFCDLCDRYYKNQWLETRYFSEETSEQMLEGIKSIAAKFDIAEIDSARELHNQNGEEKHSRKCHLRTQLKLEQCPSCERKLLELETASLNGDNWDVINDLTFADVFEGTVLLRTS